MKKKLFALILTISIIGSNSVVFAKNDVPVNSLPVANQSPMISDNFDYNDPDFDWSQIEHIEVLYINPNTGSDFIKAAIKNNVDVSFESQMYLPQPRYTYFKSLSWITRNGVVSLSMDPVNPFIIPKETAWSEAAKYFQNHPIYRGISNSSKYMSMYNQFICHADFAKGFKTPWNIEPATPDKGYKGFVAAKCN